MAMLALGLVGGSLLSSLFGGSSPQPVSLAEAVSDISNNIQQNQYAACRAVQVVSADGISISLGNVDCKGDVDIGNITQEQTAQCKMSQTTLATAKALTDLAAQAKIKGFDPKGNSTAITESDVQQNITQRMVSTCTADQETRLNNWTLTAQNIQSGGSCDIMNKSISQQLACVIDQSANAEEIANTKLTATSSVQGVSLASIAILVAVVLGFIILVSIGSKKLHSVSKVSAFKSLKKMIAAQSERKEEYSGTQYDKSTEFQKEMRGSRSATPSTSQGA